MFVPGGEASLGFDPERWTPHDEERESFRASAEEYGIQGTIFDYLGRMTTSPRTVELPSMIVEQCPQEPGWNEIDEQDARETLGKYFPTKPGTITQARGAVRTRVRLEDDGRITCHRSHGQMHAELRESLVPFRLPTNDEWEHLCGGGALTLFRWGDHAPNDAYPTDICAEEARWRRDWALSGGELPRPETPFEMGFTLHREPNAYGVVVSGDPYHAEVIATPDYVRGGDGGCTICGGAGFWLGWLTLATAFFDRELMSQFAGRPIDGQFTRVRRVLTV